VNQVTRKHVEITVHDLPLTCPMPSMTQWNSHPKVALRLDEHGVAHCPYCSTEYQIKGDMPKGHH
jgi:uncharacterized Zn-finger protein